MRVVPAVLLLGIARAVDAHGFGQRFDLPVPLWLWVTGAGLTLVLSFAAVIDFLPARLERRDYPVAGFLRLERIPRGLRIAVRRIAQAAAALVFVVTVIAGLFGHSDPMHNAAPTMVWVIFWVGVAFASAAFGRVWHVLNPLRTLHVAASHAWLSLTGRVAGPDRQYPQALGAWPAVLLLFVFSFGEHLWGGAAVPRYLGLAVLAYTAITFAGMCLTSRRGWLANGEAFAIVFDLFARCAPLTVRDRGGSGPVWCVRMPAVGLLDVERAPFSMIVFVLLLLAGVTFDGFIETPLWSDAVTALTAGGATDATTLTAAGLVLFPLGFLAAYLATCAAMRAVAAPGGAARGVMDVASRFVLTLVPIALAYHIAHYLTLLLNAGQLIVPLASDPLGRGWDLFGTRDYVPDPALLGVRTVWYVVVGLIVSGHVLSVYLAHVVALETFGRRRDAIASQVPMLVLMVAYTMVSLWILAQPVYA